MKKQSYLILSLVSLESYLKNSARTVFFLIKEVIVFFFHVLECVLLQENSAAKPL